MTTGYKNLHLMELLHSDVKFTHQTSYFTSWNGNKRNSSVFITSWKFSRANLWERLCSSLQAWVSAKFRIPRQLVGCSWRMRNLQHASLTELIWRMEEAGRRTYGRTLWIQGRIKLHFSILDGVFLLYVKFMKSGYSKEASIFLSSSFQLKKILCIHILSQFC